MTITLLRDNQMTEPSRQSTQIARRRQGAAHAIERADDARVERVAGLRRDLAPPDEGREHAQRMRLVEARRFSGGHAVRSGPCIEATW